MPFEPDNPALRPTPGFVPDAPSTTASSNFIPDQPDEPSEPRSTVDYLVDLARRAGISIVDMAKQVVRFHFRDPPDINEGDHCIGRSEATKRFESLFT